MLLQIMANPMENARLQMELAAVIDAGEPFVETTYNLEGDGPLALNCYGPLALNCYEVLSTLSAGIDVQQYPNLLAIALKVSGGTPVLKQ